MSQAPYLMQNTRQGMRLGHQTMQDSILRDGLTDAIGKYHMGQTAETLAQMYGITREQQDEFAYQSQQKAWMAQQKGAFISEITAIEWTNRQGTHFFEQDEYINADTTLEKLSTLRPAFVQDGTVTAGNASGINDGAAIACLVSEQLVQDLNLTPVAEVMGFAQSGIAPEVMGLGPVDAVESIMAEYGLQVEDIAAFELNEAFAAQALAVEQELAHRLQVETSILRSKTNLKGGAIALGHPIGASGTRIVATLVHQLQPMEYGIAALCIGGGMGIATLIKKI